MPVKSVYSEGSEEEMHFKANLNVYPGNKDFDELFQFDNCLCHFSITTKILEREGLMRKHMFKAQRKQTKPTGNRDNFQENTSLHKTKGCLGRRIYPKEERKPTGLPLKIFLTMDYLSFLCCKLFSRSSQTINLTTSTQSLGSAHISFQGQNSSEQV